MAGNTVGVVHQSVNGVGDGSHTDRNGKSEDINGCGTDQMVLSEDELIGSISNKVSLESQTERNIQSDKSSTCQSEQLNESDPFQNSGIFINDFSLFEIQRFMGLSIGCGNKGLVKIDWVEDIVFKFEQSVDWGAYNLVMRNKNLSIQSGLIYRQRTGIFLKVSVRHRTCNLWG